MLARSMSKATTYLWLAVSILLAVARAPASFDVQEASVRPPATQFGPEVDPSG